MISEAARRRHIPVLTQDGLTAVKYALGYWADRRMRPEDKIEQIFQLLGEYELTSYGNIDQWKEPELWEYMCLCEGTRPATLEGWYKYVEARNIQKGTWLIRGNFVNLSQVFEVQTRDASLVERFRAAFAAQPASYHEARAKWEAQCEESFAPRRRRYANIDPVEYLRDVEDKRKARQGL